MGARKPQAACTGGQDDRSHCRREPFHRIELPPATLLANSRTQSRNGHNAMRYVAMDLHNNIAGTVTDVVANYFRGPLAILKS
jgi:hypothetical protein